MKKSIFSLGVLCGAALSVFTLASCGEDNTRPDDSGTVVDTGDGNKNQGNNNQENQGQGGTGEGQGQSGTGEGEGQGQSGTGEGEGQGQSGTGEGEGQGQSGTGEGEGQGQSGTGEGEGQGQGGTGEGEGQGQGGTGEGETNKYDIEVTDDTVKVAKALVIALNKLLTKESSHHAVGIAVNGTANLITDMQGVDVEADVDFNVTLKASIGTEEYKIKLNYANGEFSTPAMGDDTQAFEEIVKNSQAELLSSITMTVEATTESEDAAVQAMADTLNGASFTLDAAVYNTLLTQNSSAKAYAEATGNISKGLYGMLVEYLNRYASAEAVTVNNEITSYDVDAAYSMDIPALPSAAQVTTVLAYLQNHSTYETLMNFGPADSETLAPLVTMVEGMLEDDFFDSEEYATLQFAVALLNVEVTSFENDEVTFLLEANGNTMTLLNNLFSSLNEGTNGTEGTDGDESQTPTFDEDTTYFTIAFTIDLENALFTSFEINIKDIAALNSGEGLGGSIALSLGLFYDDEVIFTALPDSSKTYADGNDLISKITEDLTPKEEPVTEDQSYKVETDENGNKIEYYYTQVSENEWMEWKKHVTEFDKTSGKPIRYTEYVYNNGEWDDLVKIEYEYDEYENLIKETRYSYQIKYYVPNYYVEYTYSNGLLDVETWYYYDDSEGVTPEWKLASKYIYTYGEGTLPTYRISYYYEDGDWYPDVKEEFEYDAKGNKTATVFLTPATGDVWVKDTKTVYHTDENGNVYEEYYNWDADLQDWVSEELTE